MRRIVLILLCMLAAWSAIASDLPKISENGNEYWYYLKFTQGSYVVASDGDGVVCKSAIPTGRRSQLWKVEGSATSGYTMTNKLGLTLYAVATSQGSEIRASQTPGGLNKFRFNTRGNYYTITPYSNTAQALNCWGGMGMGNDIKLYDSSDANAPMEFVGEYAAASITPVVGVIPYPRDCGLTDCGTLDMHKLEGITYFSDSTRILATRFADDLKRTAGIELPLKQVGVGEASEGDYNHPLLQLVYDAKLNSEAYSLGACMDGIVIRASDYGGFFNALQTLRQLLPTAIYGTELRADLPWICESLTISDAPQFKHRGFHFDVSRHFFTKDEVKKLLDVASIYKLNRFHWHLTDDQGWRVEIPEYPKLTTVGAVRKRSLTINDPTNGQEFYDDTEYGRGCYYTLDDLREIVDYARERNIEIIPEIDMPGHMVAAIAAYPELSCDPTREYEVRVGKGISTEVLNVGKDEVIDFLKCVLRHIAEVFPYEYIHIGGDECPTTAWEGNAECKQRVKDEGLSGVNQLQAWLVEEIGSFLRDEYGKRVVVWDELLSNWSSKFTIEPLVMCYRGMQYTSQAADKGFPSIAVPSYPMYFDLLQMGPDKLEIDSPYYGGYGDGSVNTVERVYNFNPVSNVSGREEYVLGTQCALWTESCATNEAAEYCLYPRVLALSETAWMPVGEKDFTSFYSRLQRHKAILDAKGIRYAPHYFEKPDLTADEAVQEEARSILAASKPGCVGYPDQAAFDKLANALQNAASTADLKAEIEAYKASPIILPEAGKAYKIVSASTFFRNHYEGSVLYADATALRIHYTEQTEPEELWEFVPTQGGYRLVSMLKGLQVKLQAKADADATFDKEGTTLVIRRASKPAGGYNYIPGVVNIKSGRFNLYANISGQTVANVDSTLCYPGTWRIVEVADFKARLQGLAEKAARILETANPNKAGEPTEEALDFLRTEVLVPAEQALAGSEVSKEDYLAIAARYEQFLMMERTSLLSSIDEGYYYLINNAYHTSYYAQGNKSSKIVNPKALAQTDAFKWAFEKNGDGTVMLRNKLTNSYVYVNSNAVDERLRLGDTYRWTLREVTTDQGNTGLAIVDGSGQFSWYTNPSAWTYVLLKPYDWGASIWQLIKTDDAVPTGINNATLPTSSTLYDLQGRRIMAEPQCGVFVRDGKKVLR